MRSLRPCSDSSATPSFPSQPEGKIGLPRANPRGHREEEWARRIDRGVGTMHTAVFNAQAWKPGSQHAGEKRGVAGLLLGRTERVLK